MYSIFVCCLLYHFLLNKTYLTRPHLYPMISPPIYAKNTVVAVVVYPRRDTFIERFKFKGNYKSFELEIRTKQKERPTHQSDRSNLD